MSYEVSPEAMKKTTCSKGFRCLNESVGPDCEVIRKVVTGVLLNLCAAKPFCSYCQPVKGDEGFCLCPVRVELYEKYGI